VTTDVGTIVAATLTTIISAKTAGPQRRISNALVRIVNVRVHALPIRQGIELCIGAILSTRGDECTHRHRTACHRPARVLARECRDRPYSAIRAHPSNVHRRRRRQPTSAADPHISTT
jgi:hypothetical protein